MIYQLLFLIFKQIKIKPRTIPYIRFRQLADRESQNYESRQHIVLDYVIVYNIVYMINVLLLIENVKVFNFIYQSQIIVIP
jgi:hypothetical protein